MKRIHVLRHAKSSWDDASMADHDRPLAARGQRATARIAAYIQESAFEPELVLCSTAQRCRQTLEGVREGLGSRASVEFEPGLYLANSSELIGRLQKLDDDVSSVMLIAHNPGLADLVLELAAAGPDLQRIRAKFPTAALATLSFEGEWSELTRGSAQLVDYVVPKDLSHGVKGEKRG